jgi:hypothetical protein
MFISWSKRSKRGGMDGGRHRETALLFVYIYIITGRERRAVFFFLAFVFWDPSFFLK